MFKTIERQIIEETINRLLTDGYTLSVNDGEETVLTGSTSKRAVLNAMFSTDEDILYTNKNGEESFVYFLHGNDVDVISDYGIRLEKIIHPITEEINKLHTL